MSRRVFCRRLYLHRGFTLIELMITVAIVGLLATIAVPVSELTVQRGKEQELRIALRQIREAIDSYKQAVGEGRIAKSPLDSGYPKSLEVLTEGIEDIRDPKKKQLYFLRRIPRDPFARDLDIPAADTWGKRSYASPPDDPQEGDDIFDVYSAANGTGLNGFSYRDW